MSISKEIVLTVWDCGSKENLSLHGVIGEGIRAMSKSMAEANFSLPI